ncbi:hypothetical protein [Corynebacterium aurimucosum]|uniref:hypothetical protein n=1 Tax=Corynebacterium aurimucosum TaxID=169292 RepID=UPI001879B9C8|nr:hypothetical protein [Corynebacterium aurimucosum]MBE7338124.1 hypothetical protein [Corynebacterium aurimucosum]
MDPFKDLLISQDPTTKMYHHLQRVLPPDVSVYKHSLPEKWNPNAGLAVVVMDDATQTRDTAHDRALVRVNIHSHSFDLSRRFARSVNEYLLSPMGGLGLSISRRRSTGVIVTPSSLGAGYIATCSYSCGTARKGI